MRILTSTHFFEKHGGGIERVAGQICRCLSDVGYVCEWAASNSDAAPDDFRIEALPLRCIDPVEHIAGLPVPIPTLQALRRLYTSVEKADVLIIHDCLYLTSVFAFLFGRRLGKPILLIQHIAALEFSSAVLRVAMSLANAVITRPMLRRVDQVVFISEATKKHFKDVKFRRAPRVVFNGVDKRLFYLAATQCERLANRQAFCLPEEATILVFVGRLVRKKGLDVIREVAALRPDAIIAIAGSGPIDPSKWGMKNVRVLGSLADSAVGNLMRAADALLLPSVGEGYPLVIQEALACGLPVICGTDTAEADPKAAKWLYGVRIEVGAPEITARRIVDYLGSLPDAERRQEMAEYASSKYSWARQATQLAELIEAIRISRRK